MRLINYLFVAFLTAFIGANLLVKHYGAFGLIVASAILIPFDLVIRCVIHELYSGWKLFCILFGLTLCAALVTVWIYPEAINIAKGSIAGFVAAQITAGIFYQTVKRRSKSYLLKVNMSDLVAVIFDSIVFQLIAFGILIPFVTLGQIGIKFVGGLLWYFILFEMIGIQYKILNERRGSEYE